MLQTIVRFIVWLDNKVHPNTRLCELCGERVKDVETPLHYASSGVSYVHPLHVITSTKGRKTIEEFRKVSSKSID